MPVQSLDVARIRGLYPTVGAANAQLDGPLAALMPESVIRAIIATLRATPTRPGSVSARSRRSEHALGAAARAVADLVGGRPEDVVLGGSVAALLGEFADLFGTDWQLGDEVVLSRLDADEQVRAWSRAAHVAAGVVRWAEVDLETGELPGWQYEQLIGRRTRLVTVPLGNPATGTVPDVAAISALAHRHGALVLVDAGVALPYLPIDLAALGADVLTLSTATIGGPDVAALVARPGLFEELDAAPGTARRDDFPPVPVELVEGVTAAVDHLAGLDQTASGTRRERAAESLHSLTAHLAELYAELDEALRALRGVSVLGGNDRLPVAALLVHGHSPAAVATHLAGHGVSVWSGPGGHRQVLAAYGADELGGVVFLGLMPHTNRAEIERLVTALTSLVQ